MSKFQYKMQSILDIKNKLEIQAKNEFVVANLQLEDEKEKLNALLGRRNYYENKVRELLQEDELSLKSVMEAKVAIRSLDEQLRKQMEAVKKAERVLEEKRLAMTELMKERKTQELLREQAFDEFMQEEKRSESKAIDELTSYLYGAGK